MKTIKEFDRLNKVIFEDKNDMVNSCLRLAFYYENPYFRGKTGFGFEDCINWFKEKKGSKFITHIGGFNIPSYILEDFYENQFNPLTDSESRLLETFEKNREEKHYIISYSTESAYSETHEIAHALYYLNEQYYQMMRKDVLGSIPPLFKEKIYQMLDKSGIYHPAVFADEAQAYLISYPEYFIEEIEKEDLKQYSNKAQVIFDKFMKQKQFSANYKLSSSQIFCAVR
jgi:hypothetical protein